MFEFGVHMRGLERHPRLMFENVDRSDLDGSKSPPGARRSTAPSPRVLQDRAHSQFDHGGRGARRPCRAIGGAQKKRPRSCAADEILECRDVEPRQRIT
ncbi:MAG: hypothetical protein C3F11_12230 [Methylocystaceae bacterium]|nr:MAG: hypothetical protein C3F11_12230 [Methylocystaceae bacterium]